MASIPNNFSSIVILKDRSGSVQIFRNEKSRVKNLGVTAKGTTRVVRCLNCSVTHVAALHDNYWVNSDYAAPRLIILRNPEAVPTAATLGFYTPLHT